MYTKCNYCFNFISNKAKYSVNKAFDHLFTRVQMVNINVFIEIQLFNSSNMEKGLYTKCVSWNFNYSPVQTWKTK